MQPYQRELWDLLTSPATAQFISTTSRVRGKSLLQMLMDQPFFEILEDHREVPDRKRIDVTQPVAEWIEQQDTTLWDNTGVNTFGGYSRYEITPELLTLLVLRWS